MGGDSEKSHGGGTYLTHKFFWAAVKPCRYFYYRAYREGCGTAQLIIWWDRHQLSRNNTDLFIMFSSQSHMRDEEANTELDGRCKAHCWISFSNSFSTSISLLSIALVDECRRTRNSPACTYYRNSPQKGFSSGWLDVDPQWALNFCYLTVYFYQENNPVEVKTICPSCPFILSS